MKCIVQNSLDFVEENIEVDTFFKTMHAHHARVYLLAVSMTRASPGIRVRAIAISAGVLLWLLLQKHLCTGVSLLTVAHSFFFYKENLVGLAEIKRI